MPGATGTEGLPALQLAALRVSADRITRMTVCTRPFRARGRGWMSSRSAPRQWFTITVTVAAAGRCRGGPVLSPPASAMTTGERDIAVIGCGALGMTTARQLQRAGGARVVIYAKDLPPNVRSSVGDRPLYPGFAYRP